MEVLHNLADLQPACYPNQYPARCAGLIWVTPLGSGGTDAQEGSMTPHSHLRAWQLRTSESVAPILMPSWDAGDRRVGSWGHPDLMIGRRVGTAG